MVFINDLAEYLRIHPEDIDRSVEWCFHAAIAKSKAAGIPEFKNNAMYDHFILSLAGLYYDNRSFMINTKVKEVAIQNMINAHVLELRYAEDGEE